MLKHPTLDLLHALGLHGMAKAFAELDANSEAEGLGHREWLGLLLDREKSSRQDKRLTARLRVARLRQQACVEDVDYRNPRGLDRALFQKLVEGEWIEAHDNLALIGPTGVGKTTTVAKIASEAILRRGCKVGLINLDSYKVAAFDQLGTYSKILNVPFRSTATSEELASALRDFQGLDLVIIDTTGRSQRDPESLGEMQAMLRDIPDLSTYMVLSVTTRDSELYDMASRFSMFHPRGLIVSKLDEATIYGAIYNLFQKVKIPLAYFTTGQRVPEDIEEATPERVAALILDI